MKNTRIFKILKESCRKKNSLEDIGKANDVWKEAAIPKYKLKKLRIQIIGQKYTFKAINPQFKKKIIEHAKT